RPTHATPPRCHPPHPPLRPARKWRRQARRESRPRSPTHRCGTSTRSAAPAATSHRDLRGHAPSPRPRPSLSAVRLPHGDHRGLRGGLSSSPPSLPAGLDNRDQLSLAPRAISSILVFFSLPLVSGQPPRSLGRFG